ncbi:MAG: carboxylesterase/lipase family protein [Candidatus Helarchaeota archaeon]
MKKTQIIKIQAGQIQGYLDKNIAIFKGVPYAEPPIGKLRFKPPVDKQPWTGVLEATKYSACAWQGYSELEKWLGKPKPESEDCLYLNIWTPSIDNKKRPVMFWIHGGAFIIGTGNDPLYDGGALARRGDVVVVTSNYRLGFFGFAYIPEITVNVGSLDQIKALEWVRDNIELFGGDPNNVTIFGESAGAYSVVSLCSMPAAQGLFHRVIAQSAPTIEPKIDDKITKKILKRLHIKEGNLDALRDVPAEQIINAQNKVFAANPTNILALRPLIEGKICVKHPLKAFQEGDCANIDFMIGTNFDEFKLFTAMDALRNMIAADPLKLLIAFLGMAGIPADKAQNLLDTYKKARAGKYSIESFDLFNAIITDFAFRISTIHLLEAQSAHNPNCYTYLFNWPSPGLNGILGACHALEIPFVFGTLDSPTLKDFVVGAPKTLSDIMMDSWIAFARTGNPNHSSIPEWSAYNSETRATMIFTEPCSVEHAPLDMERKAWDGLLEF